MPKLIAQTTSPNPSASRAEDFQPPTSNPQTAPGQIFPQKSALQQPSTTEVLQNRELRIVVPSGNPAPARSQVTEAKSGDGGFLLALIVAAAIIGVVRWWRRHRQLALAPPPVKTAEVVPSAIPESAAAAEPALTRSAVKKTAAKKSKSKRKRHARR